MKKKHVVLLLATAVFFFWAAGQTRIHPAGQGKRDKTATPDQSAGNPPLVVLTKVAGGFSGLMVDFLWMRMISLQKEGKVFEIVQLADWITKLEPHFTAVWAFHAWNMAYNISILYANPEHRRLWINNGIQLLRDNGLKYNPADPDLYRELGWIYQHKIGQPMDDMHFYYKQKLAGEMEDLLHGPRHDYAKAGPTAKKMSDEYKLVPEIMRTIEQYYGPLDWRLPETHALYWAYRGLHSAAAGKDTGPCDHMIFQSMSAAFMHGRLFLDQNAGIYMTTPRLDLLPETIKAYEDAIKRQKTELFMKVYASFLSEAVFICHVYGDDRNARKLFEKMLVMDPHLKTEMNFEAYLRKCDQLNIADLPMADAVAWIEGLLYQSRSGESGINAKEKVILREKALVLWKQYTAGPKNRKFLEIFPGFELIDRQALRRAEETKTTAGSDLNPQMERNSK